MSLNVSTSAEKAKGVSGKRQRFRLINNNDNNIFHGQLISVDQVPLNELVVIRKGADGWTGCILSLDGQTAEFQFEQTKEKRFIDLTEFDVLRLEF